MNLDTFFQNLPFIGTYFEKTFIFWRAHTVLANLTHAALGFGIALLLLTRYKKLGLILVVAAGVIHLIGFLS